MLWQMPRRDPVSENQRFNNLELQVTRHLPGF
jgi:hypothetical protein